MFCRHSKQQTSSEDTLAVKAKYRRKRPSVIRDTDEQVAPALMKVRHSYVSISTCSEQFILPRAQSCLYKWITLTGNWQYKKRNCWMF